MQKLDGTQYEVVVREKEGNVEFEGLPEEFQKPMSVFSNQEKKEKSFLCLHAVLRDAERIGRPVYTNDDEGSE